jgi:GntR family transcriptional regulator, trigonelline degradation regulator
MEGDFLSQHFSDLRVEPEKITVRRKVGDVLRNAILEGRFEPGERLIERELCALTGVSRTSVREALRHLESEGLVRSVPNKGPVVADLTLDEARQIYEVREALEPLAASLFAERASDVEFKALKEAITKLEAAFARDSLREVVLETAKLYDVILGGCHNDVIAGIIRGLQARVTFLRTTSMSNPGRSPKSLNEMQDICGAIARRDSASARAFSEIHVRRAAESALSVLRRRSVREPISGK